MAKINKTDIYPIKENINFQDYLIGTDGESNNKETVSFKIFTLLDYLSKNLTALNLIFETLEDAKYYLITNQLDFGTLIFVKESNSFMYVDSSEIDFKYLLEDAGKVNSVNGVLPDVSKNVTLKISNLEDDKGLALLTDLNNEINNRINDYNELQLSIGTETSNRITQINNIEQKLQTEKSERISEDDILNYKIDTTKTELNTNFDAKLSQESTLRQNQDAVLDNKITTEKTDRINADNLKLDKPTTTGSTISHPNVVGVDDLGNSAKIKATDFGKVDKVMGVAPDNNKNVDISGVATNWTNASQRFSGLVDKSADATFNQLIGVDSNGYAAKVGLPAMTNEMSKSTDAQKDAFRLASRKSNEKFNSNAPVLLVVNPFLLKNSNDFPTSVIITGNNLFIDKERSKVEIRKIKTINELPEIGNWIDLTTSASVSESNQNILSIYHNFKQFEIGYYEIKVTNHLGLANLTSPLFLIVDNYEETITNPLIVENSRGNIQNALQVNSKGFELTGNSTVNGGVLFNDLVNIVDSNVNSITKLSLVLQVPVSDYNIGTLSVGFTDVNEINSATTTKMGIHLNYWQWTVQIKDQNNISLRHITYENGRILYSMNFYIFIKDGTYSILSENTNAVSSGFYTDLQKIKLMFNIISPVQNTTNNYKLSLNIASFKKL